MKIVKLIDYTEEYVYDKEYNSIIFADDINYIKELKEKGHKIFGINKEPIFDKDSKEFIKEIIEDYVYNNGYDGMEERIDFESEKFEAVVTALNNWVDSLGSDNYYYSQDKNTIIELE